MKLDIHLEEASKLKLRSERSEITTWNVVSWDQVPVDVDVRRREVGLLGACHHQRGHPVSVRVNLSPVKDHLVLSQIVAKG